MDKHRSFRFFSSTAKTTDAISRGVDALRLHEKPSRLLPTAGNANIEAAERVQYPLRPSEPDCSYYLKTGCCKFGSYCRFNHPRERRLPQIFNSKERDKGSPKEVGRCKFYLMPGGCRFGEACRYSYSHGNSGNVPVDLNVIGLPVRPGEVECPYYIRTGICKYSTSCKFNHPEPKYLVGVQFFGFQNGISFENKIQNLHLIETSQTLKTASNKCIHLLDSSKPYAPAMSFSQWLNVYMDLDQPVCFYFDRFGICKYGPACQFDHPVDGSTDQSSQFTSL